MTNPPPSKYKIDDLCSISMGKKIFEITLHEGLFDVPTVDRILQKIDGYVDGKSYLTMINCEKSARTTIKALRRMGRPDALQYSIAKAYVIHTFRQRIMADIFVLLFKPKKPVKFFKDDEKARKWLGDLVIFEK
jgi:hypothetical protein